MKRSKSAKQDGTEPFGDRRAAGAQRKRRPTKSSRGSSSGSARLPVALEEGAPEFVGYWCAIMLRKWSILALVVGSALITTVVVLQMTPVYRSTATVLVDIDKSKAAPMGGADIHLGAYYREYLQTQAEVL